MTPFLLPPVQIGGRHNQWDMFSSPAKGKANLRISERNDDQRSGFRHILGWLENKPGEALLIKLFIQETLLVDTFNCFLQVVKASN